jgi:hypothetical protein
MLNIILKEYLKLYATEVSESLVVFTLITEIVEGLAL